MKEILAFSSRQRYLFCRRSFGPNQHRLRLLQTIPLPELKGGDFDHFDVDSRQQVISNGRREYAVEVLIFAPTPDSYDPGCRYSPFVTLSSATSSFGWGSTEVENGG